MSLAKDLVDRNVSAGRLCFSVDMGPAVRDADAVFIAVGTPTRRGDGHADLSFSLPLPKNWPPSDGLHGRRNQIDCPCWYRQGGRKIIRAANPACDFNVAANSTARGCRHF